MASRSGNHVELAVFGQRIRLKHRADRPELADRSVELVVAQIKAAQARAPKGSAPHTVALVALLDLAAEYLQSKERTEAVLTEIGGKSRELRRRMGGRA